MLESGMTSRSRMTSQSETRCSLSPVRELTPWARLPHFLSREREHRWVGGRASDWELGKLVAAAEELDSGTEVRGRSAADTDAASVDEAQASELGEGGGGVRV